MRKEQEQEEVAGGRSRSSRMEHDQEEGAGV